MHLHEIAADAWQTAYDKGLHDELAPLPPRLQALVRFALIFTEVGEATQEVKRHGVTSANAPAFAEELADVIIRTCELAAHHALDLDAAVREKLAFNRQRPRLFGTPHEENHA